MNRLLLAAFLILALVGCGGGGGASNPVAPPAPVPGFFLSINPTSVTIVEGTRSTNFTASIVPTNGFSEAILLTLVNPPSGIAGSGTIPKGSTSGIFNLTLPQLNPNVYTLTIKASSSTQVDTVYFSVIITPTPPPPPPDFVLNIPTGIFIRRGGSTSINSNATSINGFSDIVYITYYINGFPDPISSPLWSSTGAASLPENGFFCNTITFDTNGNQADTPSVLKLKMKGLSKETLISHEYDVDVTLNPQSFPDFVMVGTNPQRVTVKRGDKIDIQIESSPINGFNGSISLTLFNVVQNNLNIKTTGFTMDPATIVAGSKSTTTIISVADTVGAGEYSVQIQGFDGTYRHNTGITIIVE